ncbi:MAG: phosphoribosylanthranilate isomerase [Gammaproteobacteria bacterium]|nr:phosphoribosylanthranilate isomerase [Gammaproteobacteria bacterium]
MRTRVKYCGIRNVGDAQTAVELGVDAIGLVFYAPSVRAVDIATATEIADTIAPFVTRVALFLDAAADDVEAVLKCVNVDVLQFHGAETPNFCNQFDLPYIKSVARTEHDKLQQFAERYAEARALLLDSNLSGAPGGSGEVFDWNRPLACGKPIVLAGGLNADNVAAAIRALQPYGVDVSSGIESPRGTKNAALMENFMREVNRVDNDANNS